MKSVGKSLSAGSHVYVVGIHTDVLLLRRLLIRYCFHESVREAREPR